MKRAHLWSVIILCCTIGASLAFLGDSRLRGQNSDNECFPASQLNLMSSNWCLKAVLSWRNTRSVSDSAPPAMWRKT